MPVLTLHAGPLLDPDAGEERQGAIVIEGEPGVSNLLAVDDGAVEFRERREGNHAPVFHTHPAVPVLVPALLLRVIDVADIGGARVRLELEKLGKVDCLTFLLKLGDTLFGVLHLGELAGRKAPTNIGQFPPIFGVAYDGSGILRENPRLWFQVAHVLMDAIDLAREVDDRVPVAGV